MYDYYYLHQQVEEMFRWYQSTHWRCPGQRQATDRWLEECTTSVGGEQWEVVIALLAKASLAL